MPLEQWFFEMPIVTRVWTTATVLTGVLVQCQILTPFQLFYSFRAVWSKQQVRPFRLPQNDLGEKERPANRICVAVLEIIHDIRLFRPAVA